MEAKEKIKKLVDDLNYYTKKYFDDKQVISDNEYDMLMKELKELEKENPDLILKYSPTQNVGGSTKKDLKKVNHEIMMQSLQDVFEYEEITEFCTRMLKLTGKEELEYVVETKIDGLSASLEYKNGELVCGATRGNGNVGEDVTNNIKTINTIPHKLTKPLNMILRGEVFIGKEEFDKMNEERALEEEDLFANARNAAAGSLRQLDASVTKQRPLDMYIFNVQKSETKDFSTHSEGLDFLEGLGFNINPVRYVCKNEKEIIEKIEEIKEKRENLSFGIDGAVIKINDLSLREQIGVNFKTPKWAIAFKYPPEQKQTKLKSIEFQVGRTGAITPMAILEPIVVAGSKISKTTLHNEDFVKERDIKIGDTVIIQKAGDVIPEVIEVVKNKRNGTQIDFEMPKECPVCGALAIREENEATWYCNGIECPAKLSRGISHFVSKNAMDIQGLGESIVDELINRDLIKNIADIYALTFEDLASMKKSGTKFANNLLTAIEESKQKELYRLIASLGIRHVGVKLAKSLSNEYGSLENLMNASVLELTSKDDVGEITAKSIYDFFKEEQTIDLINRLKEYNLNMVEEQKENQDNRFEGSTFVITGTFESFKRDELSNIIESFGGKTSGSVSKKTSYVLAGEEAGSKLTKAQSLGVAVISETEFKDMIK